MWLKITTMLIMSVFIAMVTIVIFGSRHWANGTQALRRRLTPERVQPLIYDPIELDGLPAPVQRYFETVLIPGQSMIAAMQAAHTGQFSWSETQPQWVPFQSDQLSEMRPIGFDWDARIQLSPGISCFVHDAYVAGVGLLHPYLD